MTFYEKNCSNCGKVCSGCPPQKWFPMFNTIETNIDCPAFERRLTREERYIINMAKRANFDNMVTESFERENMIVVDIEHPSGLMIKGVEVK